MKVKICGLTRKEDAFLAAELGAWALGFIFWPKSPRFIEPKKAGEIIKEVKDMSPHILCVGVLVDPKVLQVDEVIDKAEIDTVQLHGKEKADFCKKLMFPVIKAFHVDSEFDPKTAEPYGEILKLADAKSTKGLGGTGELADWKKAKALKKFGPLILAGGISAENLKKVYDDVNPYAIDISSSVEDSPGVKNHQKLTALFDKVLEIVS